MTVPTCKLLVKPQLTDLTFLRTQQPPPPRNVQSPAVGLDKFETEPAILPEDEDVSVDPPHSPSSVSSPVKWASYFAAQTAKIGLPSLSRAVVPALEVPKVVRGVRQYRPRVFVVNPRDAEEVSLREAPRSDSAEVRMAGECSYVVQPGN